MSKIRIKNFGPIKEGFGKEWIDVKKVTVFIGNQGSGKSTVAKLISTFTWMEKALVRGDIKAKDLEIYNRFRKKHCAYQNIHNFFRDETEIEYLGLAYSFKYSETNFKVIHNKNEGYLIPKVMYVPAERNFVSAVVQPEKLKYLPFTLNTFLEEFIRSNEEIDDNLKLPINDIQYRFDKKKRSFKLYGNDYEIILSEASSGLQSAIPLYLVSKNLAEGINKVTDFTKTKLSIEEKDKIRNQLLKILIDKTINEDLQNTAIDLLSNLTKNDCFINIVEEPEQNLFPSSQQKLLNSLLEFNNINQGNKLIMTTHSPYLINYLTLAVEANKLKLRVKNDDLKSKLNEIVPLVSALDGNDLIVYQLDEKNGTIEKLKEYKGLPSDENYLNKGLAESNDEFSKLLDLEDLCQ
jgi:predicted ATPase